MIDLLNHNKIDSILLSPYAKKENRIFSINVLGEDISTHPAYLNADIIHLHWVNFNFISIKTIANINKPIIWTLRDLWPMTGGCHYPLNCTQYKNSCGHCKQLHSDTEDDLSKAIIHYKKAYFPSDIQIVGVSSWISEQASQSFLFRNNEIETISNSVRTDVFSVLSKKEARSNLKITSLKKIILIGSQNINTFYKGFSKFIDALCHLSPEKYFLCLFGHHNNQQIASLGFDYHDFGYIKDDRILNQIYSAADVFVSPSIMEAFGKTLVEAMLSGTPAVCFDATGPKDIVIHKKTGYKAAPFKSEDLAKGISWVCFNFHYKELSLNSVKHAKEHFNNQLSAIKYKDLYQKVLASDNNSKTNKTPISTTNGKAFLSHLLSQAKLHFDRS